MQPMVGSSIVQIGGCSQEGQSLWVRVSPMLPLLLSLRLLLLAAFLGDSAWAQSLLLFRWGSGGSTLHTKTHERRTPTSPLVEGASPLGSGVHTRQARRCGWPAKGLHCMPTSEISSHLLSLCLGSRLKLYFTLLRKCGFEVLPPMREAHSRAQLSG